MFLSGEAGIGKSFVLNYFINKNKHKNIIVTAPTGIAAININGSTLHRVFKVPVDPISPTKEPLKTNETIQKADIIIIDEISMCRFDCFEYVAKYIKLAEKEAQEKENKRAIKKKVKPIELSPKQVIVVGDFFPVTTSNHRKRSCCIGKLLEKNYKNRRWICFSVSNVDKIQLYYCSTI